jgi:hypothetical protein
VLDRTFSLLRLMAALREVRRGGGAAGSGADAGIEAFSGRAGLRVEILARGALSRALAAAVPPPEAARDTTAGGAAAGDAAGGREQGGPGRSDDRRLRVALKVLRELAGLKPARNGLAAAMGVSGETIGNYERGRTVPDEKG